MTNNIDTVKENLLENMVFLTGDKLSVHITGESEIFDPDSHLNCNFKLSPYRATIPNSFL